MSNSFPRFCLLFICSIFAGFTLRAQLSAPDSSGRGSSTGLGLSQGSSASTGTRASEYQIGGVTVTGVKYLDEDLMLAVAGLKVGSSIKLPNDESIAKAIRNLWKQELFSDINITVTRIVGNKVFLNIAVEERPRLSKYNFKGIKKSEAQELKDKVNLVKSRVVT
ncbi:MAG: hypothetical protein EOP51_11080, partial [Sphingobacteriales bacterium]